MTYSVQYKSNVIVDIRLIDLSSHKYYSHISGVLDSKGYYIDHFNEISCLYYINLNVVKTARPSLYDEFIQFNRNKKIDILL
jgi:hypothetical protein